MAEQAPSKESKELKENNEHHEGDIERARKSLEKKHKPDDKESVDELRSTIEKQALKSSETVSKKAEKAPQSNVSVSDKKQSYTATMRRVRGRLSPASRAFSSVMHAPVIEQVTEVAGKTVARPSGIIGGGLFAFVGVAIVFFFARRNGFALAGSEFILLLLLGWFVGLVTEGVVRVFKRS